MNTLEQESGRSTIAAGLRRFTVDFFTCFGATVDLPDDADGHDVTGDLVVRLSESLATYFDVARLHLRFHHTTDNRGELVSFGSRVFDQMVSYLEDRSALTVLTLPRRYTGGEELLQAARPLNAGVVGLKMQESNRRWVAFNWHITYRSDDKREELFTVIVDDDGDLVSRHGETSDSSDDVAGDAGVTLTLPILLRDGAEPPPPGHDQLERATASATHDADRVPTRLPPMTQLSRLAEQARKYAIYHADLRCVEHEGEILPRLHKVLARLTGYYHQQIEEVYDAHDPDGAKRLALELDLERKIAEEVENHRLRIRITLFSYALFDVPQAVAEITLSDGRNTIDVQVCRNLYSGALQRPLCLGCGEERVIAALDHNGHLTCDDCITQCESCMEIFCVACGIATCPVCTRGNCEQCSVECTACGERACIEHVDRCPICDDAVCFGCQTACASCHTRQCRSHLRADCVVEGDTTTLICATCAVRCPGCRQYSAQLGLCELSGQRFCRNCLVTCAQCGKQAGAGFYLIDVRSSRAVCHDCMAHCPGCGSFAAVAERCHTCHVVGCAQCMARCDLCHNLLCRDHAEHRPDCGHVLCEEHRPVCAIGAEAVCLVCTMPCGICDRPYCPEHEATCKRCQRRYCRDCVRVSDLCDTCALIDRDGEFVALVDESCANDERVRLLQPHYRWLRLDNLRYTYYLGRDRQMQAALIVVERSKEGVKVRRAVKLGALDTRYRERWM